MQLKTIQAILAAMLLGLGAGAYAADAKPAADAKTDAKAEAAKPADGAKKDEAKPAEGDKAAAKADGEKVYKGLCMSCHDAGVAGAPKLGDKEAWKARIATGNDALYETAIKGKGAMPPKGGNAKLTDDEVKAAVDYMVEKSK